MGVMAQDVAPREEDRQQFPFQRRLLEAIVESTVDAILVVSIDREIVYSNQRFVDIWGIPPEVIASGSSEVALNFVQERLVDPSAFSERAEYLYSHPLDQSHE